jgi:hypothetical protein
VWRILVGYILSVELGARAMKENIVAASGLDEVINYQQINCYVICASSKCVLQCPSCLDVLMSLRSS